MRTVSGRSVSLPDLGPRGEGWVAVQTALIVAVLSSAALTGGSWSHEARAATIALGAILVLVGVAEFALGAVALGPRFSIWMAPVTSQIVETGIYGRVRHPICGGQVLIGFGVALVAASWPALALATAYAALVALKGHHEEVMIERRVPGYAAYRRRVPHVWLPGIV
ncbi:MAG: hypothetical protein HY263_05080 [Chloroflexi bacterium]|nr:hypothetical protein [Chloroflexota bacterium]